MTPVLPSLYTSLAGLLPAGLLPAGLLSAGVNDPKWLDNPALTKQFLPAIGETLAMMGFSTQIGRAHV